MKSYYHLLLLLAILLMPTVGCSGPQPEKDSAEEMEELESDTDYEAQMMGESKE